jgi:hypothetical protein
LNWFNTWLNLPPKMLFASKVGKNRLKIIHFAL